MRLWHQDLIHYLPDHQLLGQHRECCALRGRGWGRKHNTVDYIFKYDLAHLFAYHQIVMGEMVQRNFSIDGHWNNRLYRGKHITGTAEADVGSRIQTEPILYTTSDGHRIYTGMFKHIYSEHDDQYLADCILNLLAKNAKFKNDFDPYSMLLKLQLAGIDTTGCTQHET